MFIRIQGAWLFGNITYSSSTRSSEIDTIRAAVPATEHLPREYIEVSRTSSVRGIFTTPVGTKDNISSQTSYSFEAMGLMIWWDRIEDIPVAWNVWGKPDVRAAKVPRRNSHLPNRKLLLKTETERNRIRNRGLSFGDEQIRQSKYKTMKRLLSF